ncbi:hypothetical protein K502DRAFT_237571 [Neoconidiobolus thromboides FSU 785]|nr:hypothetical protein K502DRAFT_237571 [Neoconidiobolus thromboides FSU 785]
MGLNVFVVEMIGDILGVISILLNLIVATTVFFLWKESGLLLGLSFILLIIFCDITLPIVGITQEVVTLSTNHNPMRDVVGCQILGVFHNVMPIGSSCGVALLSLERYLIIKDLKVPKVILWITAAAMVGGTLVLAIITAINHQFEYTSSYMICMGSPVGGIASKSLYYFMILILFTNTLIILYCYYGILKIRNKTKTLTGMNLESTNHSSQFYRLDDNNNSIKDHSVTNKEKIKKGVKIETKLFFKAVSFVACYVLFVLPSVILMIYYSVMSNNNTNFTLNGVLSSIIFASLYSFSLINPILLLFLHNKVYVKFKSLFVSLLRLIQRR